jgi:quercetin 2,3-dioxygenase
MMQLRPSSERGHANHGWLDTYHTFSFNTYYDPDHMGYRALRVINEDVIAGGSGFGTHGHNDMEIVTYVLSGALAHKDSLGSGGEITPGELQHMSAGSGIRHSEFNASETEPAHILQIWLLPTERGIKPSYNQREFPIAQALDELHLLASPDGREGSLHWVTDADLYATRLKAGSKVEHGFTRAHGWLQVARGSVNVSGVELKQGDGLELADEKVAKLAAGADGAEVLLFDLA